MDKTSKTILGVVIIIIIAGVWYGMSKESVLGPKASEARKPIKIGAILPLTGNAVQYGQESREGIELAVEEINQAGGIKGRKIEIVYEDSINDSMKGIDAYRKLNDINKVRIYLITLSNVALAVGPLAQGDRNILFTIGSASPRIGQTGDFVFRNNVDSFAEAKKMAEFAYNVLGYRRVASLMVNSDGGQIYTEQFKEAFEGLGGKVLFSENYGLAESDYRTYLLKIKVVEPEAIYILDRVKGMAEVLKQAKELGLGIPYLGAYAIESNKLLGLMGKEILEGLIYTTSVYDPDSSELLVKEFNEKSKARYGHKAEYFSALGYDSVKILAEVMKRCDEPEDTICVRDGLFAISHQGITGETSFNEIGDAKKPIVFKIIKNGKFVPYKE